MRFTGPVMGRRWRWWWVVMGRPGDWAMGRKLGVHQLKGMLHGVIEPCKEIPKSVQTGVQMLVVRVLWICILQQLFHEKDVPRYTLHRGQQKCPEV